MVLQGLARNCNPIQENEIQFKTMSEAKCRRHPSSHYNTLKITSSQFNGLRPRFARDLQIRERGLQVPFDKSLRLLVRIMRRSVCKTHWVLDLGNLHSRVRNPCQQAQWKRYSPYSKVCHLSSETDSKNQHQQCNPENNCPVYKSKPF